MFIPYKNFFLGSILAMSIFAADNASANKKLKTNDLNGVNLWTDGTNPGEGQIVAFKGGQLSFVGDSAPPLTVKYTTIIGDELKADTIKSFTTDTNLTLDPNGTGSVVSAKPLRVNQLFSIGENDNLNLDANGTGKVVIRTASRAGFHIENMDNTSNWIGLQISNPNQNSTIVAGGLAGQATIAANSLDTFSWADMNVGQGGSVAYGTGGYVEKHTFHGKVCITDNGPHIRFKDTEASANSTILNFTSPTAVTRTLTLPDKSGIILTRDIGGDNSIEIDKINPVVAANNFTISTTGKYGFGGAVDFNSPKYIFHGGALKLKANVYDLDEPLSIIADDTAFGAQTRLTFQPPTSNTVVSVKSETGTIALLSDVAKNYYRLDHGSNSQVSYVDTPEQVLIRPPIGDYGILQRSPNRFTNFIYTDTVTRIFLVNVHGSLFNHTFDADSRIKITRINADATLTHFAQVLRINSSTTVNDYTMSTIVSLATGTQVTLSMHTTASQNVTYTAHWSLVEL